MGYHLTRIDGTPSSPIELNIEENRIVNYVRSNNLSMCSTNNLYTTAIAAKYIAQNNIVGDFVEWGVFRGGNAIIAAKIFKMYKSENKVYLFDTFTGMSEPGKYDVKTSTKSPAQNKYSASKKEGYNNWAYASIEEVKENFKKLNLFDSNVIFIKGKVEDTLVQANQLPNAISFLRLDTDWYESTKIELDILYEKLIPGGILVIDDYANWNGVRKAVDEFFKELVPPIFFTLIDKGARIGVKVGKNIRGKA
jgi:hypothetical protein